MTWLGELVWGEENVGGKKRLEVLGSTILARMETIKQIFTEDLIKAEEFVLVDFNYTVEKLSLIHI